jgi:hypothetical protein
MTSAAKNINIPFGLGPIRRRPLPLWWGCLAPVLAGCAVLGPPKTLYPIPAEKVAQMVQIDVLRNAALTWGGPPIGVQALRGIRLLYDTRVPAKPALAVTRSVLRSNPRLDRFEALVLATEAIGDARAQGLDYGFFCAVLLQESAFDPRALSSAGAIGIAQFTIDTADAYGVDPFDWRDAMRGSAALLGAYLRDYDGVYSDPYAATLAAYNAGPMAVRRYHGVPPYRETRDYIGLVYDRWSRIVRDVSGVVIPRS